MSFPSDLEIASEASLKPLSEIAAAAGIPEECLEPYGTGAAKISLDAIEKMATARRQSTSSSRPSPPRRSARARPPRPSASVRRSSTSAARPPSPSASPRWARPSASRAGLPAAATARSCRWSCSTFTSPATCTPSPQPTTCARPLLDAHLYHGNECGFDIHNITWRRVSTSMTVRCATSRSASADAWTASPARPASTSRPPQRSWPRWRSARSCTTCEPARPHRARLHQGR